MTLTDASNPGNRSSSFLSQAKSYADRALIAMHLLAEGKPRLARTVLSRGDHLVFDRMKRSFVDFHLADGCNLACACCNHYSPLAKDYSPTANEVEDQLRAVRGFVDVVHLLGGEPLTHPDLIACLEAARRACPLPVKLILITNGILLKKMPEEFWAVCRDDQISIQLSRYPIGLDYEGLVGLIVSQSVHIEDYPFRDMSSFWKTPIHEDGSGDAELAFGQCWHNTQFYRGKVYRCSNCAYVHCLNEAFGRNIPVAEDDWIEISQVKSKADLIEFISKPSSFCRYCGFDHKYRLPWSPSKHAPEEWIGIEEEV